MVKYCLGTGISILGRGISTSVWGCGVVWLSNAPLVLRGAKTARSHLGSPKQPEEDSTPNQETKAINFLRRMMRVHPLSLGVHPPYL